MYFFFTKEGIVQDKWDIHRVLITPSRESRRRFLEEIRGAIQLSKGKGAYQLIAILVPQNSKMGQLL
jgi:hypothetical protein